MICRMAPKRSRRRTMSREATRPPTRRPPRMPRVAPSRPVRDLRLPRAANRSSRRTCSTRRRPRTGTCRTARTSAPAATSPGSTSGPAGVDHSGGASSAGQHPGGLPGRSSGHVFGRIGPNDLSPRMSGASRSTAMDWLPTTIVTSQACTPIERSASTPSAQTAQQPFHRSPRQVRRVGIGSAQARTACQSPSASWAFARHRGRAAE